ncbi:deoxyribodipyrimidine photolyase-related protein [Pseudoxanthobacter soli DSM 19599]|uniref:Deoxyribodipyrimidine photolyase-related protein n=1 Tax=Pseudoxanthobacter soli DSM 19599 TaxID=1123029 RepID=A0A1M7ZLZ3_9HYPH|nr:cryptochrome/photolyase family protein [Pseudoxanthobacter soli]SHO65920.1 deoxyribodipyrimidine photolyase-related protein [Pseudoxanthobacter soli DSM 19599]
MSLDKTILSRGGHARSAGHLRFVLGDQLTREVSSLAGLDRVHDIVLMVEVEAEGRYVPHHKQKIAFLLSAMRHFAEALRSEGVRVDYVRLDEAGNTHSFSTELARAVARHAPASVIVTEPGEWRVREMMSDWAENLPVPVEIREDDRFICSHAEFARLGLARKTGRMEYFYREMRRSTGILMHEGAPEGGRWNFDPENRRALPRGKSIPTRRRFAPDDITRDVIALVAARFGDHFGDLEDFGWAVTRQDALRALDHFITVGLPDFGDYQDAMKGGEDFLFHSLISPYLNCGLLTAREVCARAEACCRAGTAPINAVEGFVRQILGWREFVRGIYWEEMPAYAASNHLQATRDLPAMYWSGETPMRCMAECIGATRRHAYAHHIQRLMVTGNFALLAGVAPAQIEAWYLAVYADAFEWVELPNVHGMAMHADGGRLGSKPYAASGAYIDRMSDYCKGCDFDPKIKLGPAACPFNYLYWNFLIENERVLSANPRLAMPYRTIGRMSVSQRSQIVESAKTFLSGLA